MYYILQPPIPSGRANGKHEQDGIDAGLVHLNLESFHQILPEVVAIHAGLAMWC